MHNLHYYFILLAIKRCSLFILPTDDTKFTAELRDPLFQPVLTTHDIDADSAIGGSIITDDRSSCRCSNNEEVSACVCGGVV